MEQTGNPIASNGQNPDDITSIRAVVTEVYKVISGPQGAPRDWDRFRSLFLPGARMIPQHRVPAGPIQSMEVDAYIVRASKVFETMSFYEIEIASRIETFGDIAHVLSTYESRYNADDPEPFMRGINSIQLIRDGSGWRVASVIWDTEDDSNPIPHQYLPEG